MKRLLFQIIVCATLFTIISCERSINEDELYAGFFDDMPNVDEQNKLHEYSFTFSNKVVYYYEDFNNPNTSLWGIGNGEYAKKEFKNGQYVITSYVNHTSWIRLNYDQTKDFQIEMVVSAMSWVKNENTHYAGGVFNMIEGISSGIALYIRRTNVKEQVVVFDFANGKDVFQNSSLTVNTPVTLTIRKINGQVSYFFDKIFLCSTPYKHVGKNIGYVISKGNTVAIDCIRVEYLE